MFDEELDGVGYKLKRKYANDKIKEWSKVFGKWRKEGNRQLYAVQNVWKNFSN